MLVFIGYAFLDLIVLCPHPCIVYIAMRMQLCQDLKALLLTTMINEPSWRLREVSENRE